MGPAVRSRGHSDENWIRTACTRIVIVMSDVTEILSAIEQGDSAAADELLPLVYDELRKLAADKMSHERVGRPCSPPFWCTRPICDSWARVNRTRALVLPSLRARIQATRKNFRSRQARERFFIAFPAGVVCLTKGTL